MKIGFTGTRSGMTEAQKHAFLNLNVFAVGVTEAHHGDCVGADSDFHALVREIDPAICIVVHPGFSASSPQDISNRAFCVGDRNREPKTHFARNRDIVNETDVLIATPPTMRELPNGGTWYTVNFARKVGKDRLIIYPNGSVAKEPR